MLVKTEAKAQQMPFWCQCRDCLEHFSLEGQVSGKQIVKLERHPRVAHNGNSTYYHRCGGDENKMGRLTFYPVLRFWRS